MQKVVLYIIYNIVERIKRLDKNIKQIIILSIITLILFTGTIILKNMTSNKTFQWDYDNIISAEEVLSNGEIITDRNLYWNLKEIIYTYISTMQDDELDEINSDNEKVTYLDYYGVLSKKYKKHLNKSDYENIANIFINKFLEEDHLGYKYVSDFIIQDIYKYDDNMYLCVLLEEYTQVKGYIGIQLDREQSKFSIFYIE